MQNRPKMKKEKCNQSSDGKLARSIDRRLSLEPVFGGAMTRI
jgi:hypothetical protein